MTDMPEKIAAILKTLERTPGALEALLGEAGDALVWRPAPDRWSIADVLVHLLDVEVNALGLRARRIVEEDNPALEDFDQVEAVHASTASGTPSRTLAAFRAERGRTVAWLREVSGQSLRRTGQHAVIGEISLWNHLNQWAFHDLGHIRQVLEIRRAQTFYPHTGNYRKFYSVNP